MKRKLCILMAAGMFLAACANTAATRTDLNQNNAVQNVLEEQIAKESGKETDGTQKVLEAFEENQNAPKEPILEAMESIESSRAKEISKSKEDMEVLMKSTEGVDFDLTNMSGDMVYAMIYQLMTEPGEYEGKVFRISGTYYPSYIDSTNQHYHYCVIKDALECCTQGIEFVRGDNSYVYPEDFPNEGDMIEVTGTFETYREKDDDRLYCRLNQSTMIVLN